jgi:hypothetical protein
MTRRLHPWAFAGSNLTPAMTFLPRLAGTVYGYADPESEPAY